MSEVEDDRFVASVEDPATGASTWAVETKDLGGYVAEVFVADYLAATDHRTRWLGGNKKGADVFSRFPDEVSEADIIRRPLELLPQAAVKVDAKRTTIKNVSLDGASVEVVSFLAKTYESTDGVLSHARTDLVTHFGLVVLATDSAQQSEVVIDKGVARMSVQYALERLYLVPAAVINDPSVFRRKQNRAGEESGLELVAATAAVAPFLVQVGAGVVHRDYRIPTT